MINEILSVGVLLGSLVSPLVNAPADASSSVETSEETTASYTLASTGETFLESDIVWNGDGDNFRSYTALTSLSDPFHYLDTTLGLTDSTTANNFIFEYQKIPERYSQRTWTFNRNCTNFSKWSSYESKGSFDMSVGYQVDNGSYVNFPTTAFYSGFVYENSFLVTLNGYSLEYWQETLDFSIMEITRFAPYSGTGYSNTAVEMASVCRPDITIEAYSDTHFRLKITLYSSSFRLIRFEDGSLCSTYPTSISTSDMSTSLIIYPSAWIKKELTSDMANWPVNQKQILNNETNHELLAFNKYSVTSTTSISVGPVIGKGYYGLAPWYYGAEITTANTMMEVGGFYPWFENKRVQSLSNPYFQAIYTEYPETIPAYNVKISEGSAVFVCGTYDWSLYGGDDLAYVCVYSVNEASNYCNILTLKRYGSSSGGETSEDGGGTDAGGNTYYVYNFTDFWWKIIAIPFAFLSQAFNVTLFQGTPYAINITTILFTTLAVIIVVALINLLIKMFKK